MNQEHILSGLFTENATCRTYDGGVNFCLREYWDEVWAKPDFDEYRKYVDRHISALDTYEFISHFQSNRISSICDAACGFGAYSIMLCIKGFQLSGFDISANSVNLTKAMLAAYNCTYNDYKVCDITNIGFEHLKRSQKSTIDNHCLII